MKCFYLINLILILQSSSTKLFHQRSVASSVVDNNGTNTFNYEVSDQKNLVLISSNVSYNCDEKICVMKCCSIGFLLIHVYEEPECVPVRWYNTSDYEPPFDDKDNIILIPGFPNFDLSPEIPSNIICATYDEDEFELTGDGEIYHYVLRQRFPHEVYCLDKAVNNGTIGIYSRICHEKPDSQRYNNQYIAKIIIWIPVTLSFVFLIIIFFLHFLARHNLNLKQKCTLSACISQMFGFLWVLLSRVIVTVNEAGCTSTALMGQFFFMSFYFWFCVMCFEISRIIRGTFKLTSMADMSQKSQCRYLCYSLFSWGVPFLLCSFTTAMQIIPLEDFPLSIQPYIVKPGLSKGRCWFEHGLPTFLYFVLFEVVLDIFNAIFMFHAAYLLYKEQIYYLFCSKEKEKPKLRTHTTANHVEAFKIQFLMFILYLIMLMVKAISQAISGNQYLRIMIIILSLHTAFLFLVIIQTSKSKEVVKFFKKFRKRAQSIQSLIGFSGSTGSSGTEVTQL